MYVIITTTDKDELILFGPFNSRDALYRYVAHHDNINTYIIAYLHDCGDAMDA